MVIFFFISFFLMGIKFVNETNLFQTIFIFNRCEKKLTFDATETYIPWTDQAGKGLKKPFF